MVEEITEIGGQADRTQIHRGPMANVSPLPRIEGVAQAVADEVEAEQGDREEGRGEDQQPRRPLHLAGALGDQHAPGGQRLLL